MLLKVIGDVLTTKHRPAYTTYDRQSVCGTFRICGTIHACTLMTRFRIAGTFTVKLVVFSLWSTLRSTAFVERKKRKSSKEAYSRFSALKIHI